MCECNVHAVQPVLSLLRTFIPANLYHHTCVCQVIVVVLKRVVTATRRVLHYIPVESYLHIRLAFVL